MVAEIILAIVLALAATFILVGLAGWRAPTYYRGVAPSITLFVLLFLAIWALSALLTPFGPVTWGVAFLPFLWVWLFIMLLLLAAAPPARPPVSRTDPGEAEAESESVALGLFFWVLLIVLVVSLFWGYR